MGPPGQDRRDTCKGSVTTTVVESLTGVSRKPAEARPSGIEPPGPDPVSRYMTSVPFVALIVCVPVDVQLLLNVEPPVNWIVSATI
jgi:hypothetical protein